MDFVKEIFDESGIRYLVTAHPLIELKTMCEKLSKSRIVSKVNALEEILGPVHIKLINPSEGSKSKAPTYFKNYTLDFLPSKL